MAKKSSKKTPGRPRTVNADLWWGVRIDEDTEKALKALAKAWKCGKSEAMRKAVKERARRMGVV